MTLHTLWQACVSVCLLAWQHHVTRFEHVEALAACLSLAADIHWSTPRHSCWSCCPRRAGLLEEMEAAFESMQARHHVAPSVPAYLALLEAYAAHGQAAKAHRTLVSMRRLRYRVGPEAFHFVFRAYAEVWGAGRLYRATVPRLGHSISAAAACQWSSGWSRPCSPNACRPAASSP